MKQMSFLRFVTTFLYGLFRAGAFGTLGLMFTASASRDLKSLANVTSMGLNSLAKFVKGIVVSVAQCSPLGAAVAA